MPQALDDAIAYSKRWLDIIKQPAVTEAEGKAIIKSGFIVAVSAFHGKTMGSLSMMGKADYRQPPGMLYGGPVCHVPFGDANAVERQLDCRDRPDPVTL
jgi:acetylornithine/succinyldiaminopimelate/putrescine aminotransferase